MRTRFSIQLLAAALACLLGTPAPAADALQRGVLIDRQGGRVMLMSPDSAIENVSIKTGKTAWISRDGAMPIALGGGRLLVLRDGAERSKLAYAVVDIADGRLLSSAQVDLPAQASGLIDDRLDERFDVVAAADGLRWSHRHEPVQGARMADDLQQSSDKQERASRVSGALAIDWTTGRLAPVAESSLKSASAPAAEIGSPSATEPRNFRSVGDGYRLQSERLKDGRYRWLLSDVSGTRVGEVVSEYSYRPFDVVDGRLLYVTVAKVSMVAGKAQVEMPTLVVMDLGSGAVAWKREVRDTRYRGPFPS